MDDSYAYSEVLEILNNMDKKYVNKIPKKLLDFFNNNSSKNYIEHINPEQDLKEQKLSKKTLDILALINLKYWTKSEEHRKELLMKYRENGRKLEEELARQYSTDNLFKNKRIQEVEKKEEVSLIERKETFIERVFNFIKNIFKKNK